MLFFGLDVMHKGTEDFRSRHSVRLAFLTFAKQYRCRTSANVANMLDLARTPQDAPNG